VGTGVGASASAPAAGTVVVGGGVVVVVGGVVVVVGGVVVVVGGVVVVVGGGVIGDVGFVWPPCDGEPVPSVLASTVHVYDICGTDDPLAAVLVPT